MSSRLLLQIFMSSHRYTYYFQIVYLFQRHTRHCLRVILRMHCRQIYIALLQVPATSWMVGRQLLVFRYVEKRWYRYSYWLTHLQNLTLRLLSMSYSVKLSQGTSRTEGSLGCCIGGYVYVNSFGVTDTATSKLFITPGRLHKYKIISSILGEYTILPYLQYRAHIINLLISKRRVLQREYEMYERQMLQMQFHSENSTRMKQLAKRAIMKTPGMILKQGLCASEPLLPQILRQLNMRVEKRQQKNMASENT